MSVYKLIPSHYVSLRGCGQSRPLQLPPPPPPPCTAEQFENLKLLLRASNSKLAGLAATVRELREQLRERDATIARLTAAAVARTTLVRNKVEVRDVLVDVSSDIQVRLQVELEEREAGPPAIKVASSVVTRRPASTPSTPAASARPDSATGAAGGPGPVRASGLGGGHATSASPLYASLMWRTRQRAKELGYRFVWSRYGKILVKKDVQSPSLYILDEADLRKMV